MFRNRNRLLLLILSALLILTHILLSSCSTSIIGLWQDVNSDNKVEFTDDSKVILDTKNNIFTGSYELLSDDYITIEIEGLIGVFQSLFGKDKWNYQLKGNSLTLVSGDTTIQLERLK